MASAAIFLTALAQTSKAKVSKEQQEAPAPIAPSCTGEGYKLVNGVCEAGTQIWTRSEWDSTQHFYRCYYYYRWSDNSTSQEYFIINGAGCIA
jgi:hypothetical protein